ncbi:DUF6878 family protein [Sphingomonas koreensis]
MTDTGSQPAFDAGDFMARYEAYRQRSVALVAGNKARLMAVLAAAGITSIVVAFDGVGDSGQIDSIVAKAGDEEAALPQVEVELARMEFGSDTVGQSACPLPEAIEALCYALLESEHGGWENNEGAYGEFVFDVAAATIALDFNYRIETTENHSHLF